MSDDGGREQDPLLPIRDMEGFCENVISRTDGLDFAAFTSDAILYEATLWNIALMGEAVTNVAVEIEEGHPEVPWGVIVRTRNRIIHRYWAIRDDIIWEIITEDLPVLLPMLRAVLVDSE